MRPVVAVVVGGESEEFDISLASGREVLRGLDPARWNPFVIRIDRDGGWCFPRPLSVDAPAEPLGLGDGINELLRRGPHVVFPVMHGPYGEDGRFQSLLELLHLPYVGSTSDASALAMNKARTRDVLAQAGLRVAPAEELTRGATPTITPPCVVKPMRLGSSVGLMVVQTPQAFQRALETAFEHDDLLLIETFVQGRELTAGVLEERDGSLQALPLVEIRPNQRPFFDYEAKYTPGATEEICPALVPEGLRQRIQACALTAHQVLGCRGMSRTDVIVDDSETIWVLETNTIPGMTQTSLLPQAAAAAGLPFSELLTLLLDVAYPGSEPLPHSA